MKKKTNPCLRFLSMLLVFTFVGNAVAQVEPEKLPIVAGKEYRHADLDIAALHQSITQFSAQEDAWQRLSELGVNKTTARIDLRSGRFATLMPTTPLIPGRGIGNTLHWEEAQESSAPEQAVLSAFEAYLTTHQDELRLDLDELGEAKVTTYDDGELYQIYWPRTFDGIPVRDSYVTASVRFGNLVLMSFHQWGDRSPAADLPTLSLEQASAAAWDFLAPLTATGTWAKAEQVYIPMADNGSYRYQLAWAIRTTLADDGGHWEILVDAHSGKILANQDTNHYAEAKGGVLPVTNDGLPPDGVEQGGWPMPFMNIGSFTTDTGGNFSGTSIQTATFTGPYVEISDNCGSASLAQSDGIDWGISTGTDCATPGIGGAGNTHASRTGFYELNKVMEMARGQLPSNAWLSTRLTANMNINSSCNAFWNGTVNFYRSGNGCSNTGEIAGVFDHEWGHGMDANDAIPGIASPSGEGIADIYTALRLNSSCIGRNFRSTPCTGNGDPCLSCTGVRDIDYLKRASGMPHDYTWSNANCSLSVHCVGGVYSEAVWSLWKRKLQNPPYNYDNNTAQEITTRLTFIGAGNTGTWFSGGPPYGGCAGNSGYNNYLVADDDNGDLNDGTPHMQAIYQAFNDQEIACQTPTVQDTGCTGAPSSAPTVNGSGSNTVASLTWSPVTGAAKYQIFRTEGVFGCDFGKVKIGESTSTSWTDSGLQNGRDYSYIVVPIGTSNACMGPASPCTTVTPTTAADFSVSCSPSTLSVEQGADTTSACTVTAIAGYSGTVDLACTGQPVGVDCAFSPGSVSPTGSSTLLLSTTTGQAPGTFTFTVDGNDGSNTRSAALGLTVTPMGQQGPQDAVYNASLGAPYCSVAGSSCDSQSLLEGRGPLGPEPNQPNTLDGCTDGGAGTYLEDESNERIVVSTLDGYDLTHGSTVQVDATVHAWASSSSDTLDLYYAADANSPSWVHIASLIPPVGGIQTLSAQYTLPDGPLQAVRANFRFQGAQSPCSENIYDDSDDLVFAVRPKPSLVISSEIPAATNAEVEVPVQLNSHGKVIAGTAFSIDYDASCLEFDSTDTDTDGIPDSITFHTPPNFDTNFFFDPADTDGEIDISITDAFAPIPLADGSLVTITFTTTCIPVPPTTITAPVGFSAAPSVSFSNLNAQSIPGTSVNGSVEIHPGIRGDCNNDEKIDIADLVACELEVFDGDGNFWLDVPGGSYFGSPVGCDANADATVDAGDLTCKNRLIFGQTCADSLLDPGIAPRLSLPRELPASAGKVIARLELNPGEHALSGTIFSINYDETRLAFDPTDTDLDGVPDAIRFLGAAVSRQVARFDATNIDAELTFMLADLVQTPSILADGALVEIEFQSLEPVNSLDGAVAFGETPAASFGDPMGRSIAGSAGFASGSIFADGFDLGTTAAWSSTVP